QSGSQDRANHESGATAILQNRRQYVRRVRPKIAPEILAHFRLRKFGKVIDQLLFVIAPGEIGITLVKTGLGQYLHHLWSSKRFRQKNRVWKFVAYPGDQIFPERHGL